jgi:hypothetical protein
MNQKRLCLALLLLISTVIFACGDGDDVKKEESHLIRTEPPDGSKLTILLTRDITIYANLTATPLTTLKMHFDRPPATVIVNGNPAKVTGTVATTELKPLFSPVRTGSYPVTIEWTYPDGSGGKGAVITLRVVSVLIDDMPAPKIVGGTVKDGDRDVDADRLNAEGITLEFSEPLGKHELHIRPEDGEPLGWEIRGENEHVTLTPGDGGKLVGGKIYLIEGKVTDQAGNEARIEIVFETK